MATTTAMSPSGTSHRSTPSVRKARLRGAQTLRYRFQRALRGTATRTDEENPKAGTAREKGGHEEWPELKISDINADPGRFHGKEIQIAGRVTQSIGALGKGVYLLNDGSGSLWVYSDKLGVPSAVWSSTRKLWIDPKGHLIKTRGPEDIARCPFRIAIVSTGLFFHDSEENMLALMCWRDEV